MYIQYQTILQFIEFKILIKLNYNYDELINYFNMNSTVIIIINIFNLFVNNNRFYCFRYFCILLDNELEIITNIIHYT